MRPRVVVAARVVLVAALIVGRIDPMAPKGSEFEQAMARLEAELKRLEAEYMFFAGRLPRLPWETRARVDKLVKQCDRMHIRNTAEKFRFSTLQARYTWLFAICGSATSKRRKRDGRNAVLAGRARGHAGNSRSPGTTHARGACRSRKTPGIRPSRRRRCSHPRSRKGRGSPEGALRAVVERAKAGR